MSVRASSPSPARRQTLCPRASSSHEVDDHRSEGDDQEQVVKPPSSVNIGSPLENLLREGEFLLDRLHPGDSARHLGGVGAGVDGRHLARQLSFRPIRSSGLGAFCPYPRLPRSARPMESSVLITVERRRLLSPASDAYPSLKYPKTASTTTTRPMT